MSDVAPIGWAPFAARRDRAVRALHGRVLELGAGEGANFGALASDVAWIGLEPSRRRRARLVEAARRLGHTEPPLDAVAEAVPLPDASVDAVLATTVLCSVRDQRRVLAEIERVLRPGGRVVLAEHVVARRGSIERVIQHVAKPWSVLLDHGCDPTRDTERAVRESGLLVEAVGRFLVPVLGRLCSPFVVIEASRAPTAVAA